MPSLIPFLLAEPALPVAVRASLRTYAHAPDPQVRARARHVAAAGLHAAFDLTEREIADLLDPAHPRGELPASPRAASPSRARAQNT